MIIQNVKVYTEDKKFKKGTIFIKGGVFDKIVTKGVAMKAFRMKM